MKMKNDRRSEPNLCNCVRSPKKIQDFNGVWTRDLAITDATLYQLSYEATDVGSRSIVGSYVPVKEMMVNDIWNKSYMNCRNEMKMKKWSSQWTQFMQLRKEAWKKFTNTHFFHGNIWTHNWPAPNVSGFIAQLVEHRTGNREVTGSNPVDVLNFFQASLRNCIHCVHCDDHFFIFISFLQFIYDLFHISLTLLLL